MSGDTYTSRSPGCRWRTVRSATYHLRIWGYSRRIERAKSHLQALLWLSFTDAEGRQVFRHALPVRALRTTLKPLGPNPGGFEWEDVRFVSAESYHRSVGVTVTSTGVP